MFICSWIRKNSVNPEKAKENREEESTQCTSTCLCASETGRMYCIV